MTKTYHRLGGFCTEMERGVAPSRGVRVHLKYASYSIGAKFARDYGPPCVREEVFTRTSPFQTPLMRLAAMPCVKRSCVQDILSCHRG